MLDSFEAIWGDERGRSRLSDLTKISWRISTGRASIGDGDIFVDSADQPINENC